MRDGALPWDRHAVVNAYEIHLTVGYDVERAAEVARRHGAKFAHIMLDRGREQSQPMITISGGHAAEDRGPHRHVAPARHRDVCDEAEHRADGENDQPRDDGNQATSPTTARSVISSMWAAVNGVVRSAHLTTNLR